MYSKSMLSLQISALSWHPDGQLLATISKDTKIRIYDPRKSPDPIQVILYLLIDLPYVYPFLERY